MSISNNHKDIGLRISDNSAFQNFSKGQKGISAYANSKIQFSDLDNNLRESSISTVANASNPSVAVARATAKAASIAASTFTNGQKYAHNDGLFTFKISTVCTIQKGDEEKQYPEIVSNVDSQSVANKSRSLDHRDNSFKPSFARGTKFDKLRREMEDLDNNGQPKRSTENTLQQSSYGSKFEKIRRDLEVLESNHPPKRITNNVLQPQSVTNNVLQPQSVTNVLQPQSVNTECFSHSNESSSFSNELSLEVTDLDKGLNRNNLVKNQFLFTDLDSNDQNSLRKHRVSDLKRSSRTSSQNSTDLRPLNSLRDLKSLSPGVGDFNRVYSSATIPRMKPSSTLALNGNLDSFLSDTSSFPETDLDSGKYEPNVLIPQTNFFKPNLPYFSDKTRSLTDLRKDFDLRQDPISKTLSTEDLKKRDSFSTFKFVDRLRSKAQSVQELRVADSVTKLNIPEWMNDFKPAEEFRSTTNLMTKSFQSKSPHPSELKMMNKLTKYKCNSLQMLSNLNKEISPKPVNLPSNLYRSRSQKLLYFDPVNESKLNSVMKPKSETVKPTESPSRNVFDGKNPNETESKSVELRFKAGSSVSENKPLIHSTYTSPYQSENRFSLNYQSAVFSPRPEPFEPTVLTSPRKQIETQSNPNIQSKFDSFSTNSSNPGHTFKTNKSESQLLMSAQSIRTNYAENLLPQNKPETYSNKRKEDAKMKNIQSNTEFDEKNPNKSKSPSQLGIIHQGKSESHAILKALISTDDENFGFRNELCHSFSINLQTMKLLMNVKRKTPNLNRDESNLFGSDENYSIVENSFRKFGNSNFTLCKFKQCRKEILHSNRLNRGNCSCYNCYSYYCSKKCRNMDFSHHFNKCTFRRIKDTIVKIADGLTKTQLYSLSKYSKEIYIQNGIGCVVMGFESCRSADDFLNGQSNRLIGQPFYLSKHDILHLLPSYEFPLYNPQTEMVLCLIVCATLPMTNVELTYPTFRYSFVRKYVENIDDHPSHPPQDQSYNPPTVTSTKSPPLTNDLHQDPKELSDLEQRQRFFYYVIDFFRSKKIDLKLCNPEVYEKLKKYVTKNVDFETMAVCIKEPIMNTSELCIINAGKEIITKPITSSSLRSNSTNSDSKQHDSRNVVETEI